MNAIHSSSSVRSCGALPGGAGNIRSSRSQSSSYSALRQKSCKGGSKASGFMLDSSVCVMGEVSYGESVEVYCAASLPANGEGASC